jgi:hypothetical protein
MMMPPPGGGGDEEMILVVMMMFCCIFSVIAGAGWFFLMAPEEGDECSGKDENGNYEIDDKGKCVLVSCNTGYYKSGKECLVDHSGKDCTGADPNATYETDVSNVCSFVMCDYGYNIDDSGTCVEVEDDGSAGRLTSYVEFEPGTSTTDNNNTSSVSYDTSNLTVVASDTEVRRVRAGTSRSSGTRHESVR